jgi:hypothetical protein
MSRALFHPPEAAAFDLRDPRVRRGQTWRLLLLLLVVGLWNMPTLWYPYGQDHALAHIIGRIILDGGIPYVEALDDKPPGVFYLYALLISWGGEGMHWARIAGLLSLGATMVLMVTVGRVAGAVGAGLWGALLFGLAHPLMGFWNTALQEDFLLPLLWGSLLCGIVGTASKRTGSWALAGLLLGVVFWFKYPYALPLGILLVASAWSCRRRDSGWTGGPAAVVGAFLVVVALGTLYLWSIGALWEMVQVTVLKNLGERVIQSTRLVSEGGILGRWAWMVPVPLFLLILASGLGGAICLPAGLSRGRWILAGYTVCALALIYVQMRFFQYHWIPFLSFWCFLGGIFLIQAGGWLGRWGLGPGSPWRRRGAILFAVLLLALGAFPYARSLHRWWLAMQDRISWEPYLASFPDDPRLPPYVLEDWMISRSIADMAPPPESVFIWGSRPLVYYFSELLPPTRFLYINHLFLRGPRGDSYRNEVQDDLLARPPDVILVVTPAEWKEAMENMEEMVPGLHELVTTQYMLTGKVGPYLFYEPEGKSN